MGKSLNDFIKDNQKFLKIPDGETVNGTLLGSRVIPNKFDVPKEGEAQKETVEYGIELPDGRKVIWTCGRMDVAQDMLQLKKGDVFSITRLGDGPKTKYFIKSPSLKKQNGMATRNEDGDAQEGDEVPF